jgi:hypothetical protein
MYSVLMFNEMPSLSQKKKVLTTLFKICITNF